MNKQILISMLRKGSTGSEILKILDVIISGTTTEEQSDLNSPTFEEIAF